MPPHKNLRRRELSKTSNPDGLQDCYHSFRLFLLAPSNKRGYQQGCRGFNKPLPQTTSSHPNSAHDVTQRTTSHASRASCRSATRYRLHRDRLNKCQRALPRSYRMSVLVLGFNHRRVPLKNQNYLLADVHEHRCSSLCYSKNLSLAQLKIERLEPMGRIKALMREDSSYWTHALTSNRKMKNSAYQTSISRRLRRKLFRAVSL